MIGTFLFPIILTLEIFKNFIQAILEVIRTEEFGEKLLQYQISLCDIYIFQQDVITLILGAACQFISENRVRPGFDYYAKIATLNVVKLQVRIYEVLILNPQKWWIQLLDKPLRIIIQRRRMRA